MSNLLSSNLFSSNPNLIGLDEKLWTKTRWTKTGLTKTGRTASTNLISFAIRGENIPNRGAPTPECAIEGGVWGLQGGVWRGGSVVGGSRLAVLLFGFFYNFSTFLNLIFLKGHHSILKTNKSNLE